MLHPFQAICTIRKCATVEHEYVIAACGPRLFCIQGDNGEIKSQWAAKDDSLHVTVTKVEDDQERPGKKRKVENSTNDNPANIIILVPVTNSANFIVVTGEDKCLRVFQIDGKGQLSQVNSRCMPKRPCALEMSTDGKTIYCGDKFGDVYSLPLLYDDTDATVDDEHATETPPPPLSVYKPSATDLTVHTQRNRKALENQIRSKGRKVQRKEAPRFQHETLLGHVSMLTDMQCARRVVDGKHREYLITSDRDEHIRISRGPPQSHVIEQYCLGHIEFVSRIKLIPGTDLLISGGGVDWLGVWNWTSGALVAKLPLSSHTDKDDASTTKTALPAVTGLWLIPQQDKMDDLAVLIGMEKSKIAVLYRLSELQEATARPASSIFDLSTYGNLLDVTVSGNVILASFDTTSLAANASHESTPNRARMRSFLLEDHADVLRLVPSTTDVLDKANDIDHPPPSQVELDRLLYGVENLRKREGFEDGAEIAQDNDL